MKGDLSLCTRVSIILYLDSFLNRNFIEYIGQQSNSCSIHVEVLHYLMCGDFPVFFQ